IAENFSPRKSWVEARKCQFRRRESTEFLDTTRCEFYSATVPMFLVNTPQRNPDRTFGHERIAKGAYAIYEITKQSEGKEAKEKTLADIPVDEDALLLIHGFNNDFDRVSAAYIEFERKIAKAGFDGNVVGFTWPSYGVWSEYLGDRGQAEYAAFGFLNFLLDVRPLLGARQLHLKPHSLGGDRVI